MYPNDGMLVMIIVQDIRTDLYAHKFKQYPGYIILTTRILFLELG